jgi:ABC-type Fe3+-siderophore transport system permease subunit
MVIAPAHGKAGTIVHVTGTGFVAGLAISGTLCGANAQGAVDNPIAQCDVAGVVSVTPDGSGAFAVDYTVGVIPKTVAGYQIGFGRLGDTTGGGAAVFTVDK